MNKINAHVLAGYGSQVKITYKEIVFGEEYVSESRGYLTHHPDSDPGDWDTDGLIHIVWEEEEGNVEKEELFFSLNYVCTLEEVAEVAIGPSPAYPNG